MGEAFDKMLKSVESEAKLRDVVFVAGYIVHGDEEEDTFVEVEIYNKEEAYIDSLWVNLYTNIGDQEKLRETALEQAKDLFKNVLSYL